MLTTITLGGHLGRRFGTEFRLDLDVPSPGEAVRALSAICKGFREHILKHGKRGYHVFVGRKSVREEDELVLPSGATSIHIMPALAGAKSGWLGVVLGGLLIAAGAIVGAFYGWTGVGGAVGHALVGLGLSMGFSGISTLLSGQPPAAQKEKADGKNYVFSGPVNTTGVGNAVPVVYGKLEVGSQVIFASVNIRPIAPKDPWPNDDPTPNPGPGRWHRPRRIA